jgi:alkyl hydroperoxide reductase subunit F
LIEKVKALPNVEIILQCTNQAILGDQMVTGIKYKDLTTNEEKIVEVQGIMVHAGMIPNSDLINNCRKKSSREIIVDCRCQTNLPEYLLLEMSPTLLSNKSL